MSASPEELDYALECTIDAIYTDLWATGNMTVEEILDKIREGLEKRGATF